MAEIGPTEIRLMQGLAQEVTALRPELLNGDATIGELAWVWGQTFDALNQYWRHRMWFVDDELAGWGWVCLPFKIERDDGTFRESNEAMLTWQVHPDRSELLEEILDWYDEVAGEVDRIVIIQSVDKAAQAIVASHGYEYDEDDGGDEGDWIQFNSRDLLDIPDPVLPNGFQFASAEDVSLADAVISHRSAWERSTFTEASMERVQQTWPYRKDLHLFVQAPDGTIAGNATIWFDEQTQTAEFEPVGTHPEFRRMGLGTALQLHGMHKAKAAGAIRMFVACLGAPSKSAARDLYHGVGFRPITRDLPQIKVARGS